jgi:hypothetical protein
MSNAGREAYSSFLTLWTETNQKILREMTEFSLGAVAEGFRVAGEVQAALVQSAGRLQGGAKDASERIREELSSAISETQTLSSPARD